MLISNDWRDVTDSNHKFDLCSANDTWTAGSFGGREEDANDTSSLSGWWADNRIQFAVQRATGTVRYSGSIPSDSPDVLSFTSSAGPLRIQHISTQHESCPPLTTDSAHDEPVFPDLLRDVQPDGPN